LGSSSRLMSMIFWNRGSMADPYFATGIQDLSELSRSGRL
jgi:hypothetical protein